MVTKYAVFWTCDNPKFKPIRQKAIPLQSYDSAMRIARQLNTKTRGAAGRYIVLTTTPLFSVTYDIVTPESAEYGDYTDTGFICENVSLRDAIADLQADSSPDLLECDSYPVSDSVRWVTAYRVNDGTREYYEQGKEESRTLHFPQNITPASKKRILKLLGVRLC